MRPRGLEHTFNDREKMRDSSFALVSWRAGNVVPQKCPTRVSYKSAPQECPTRVSHKSVLQDFPTRVPHKSVLQECPTRVSYKTFPQECPTRVLRKSVRQKCHISYKSVHKYVLQDKSAPQECPTRVSYESVPQECPTRCSTRVRKCVAQRFPKRMCATRASHNSISYKSAKNCLGVCFRVRVGIRVRGFHLVPFQMQTTNLAKNIEGY